MACPNEVRIKLVNLSLLIQYGVTSQLDILQRAREFDSETDLIKSKAL